MLRPACIAQEMYFSSSLGRKQAITLGENKFVLVNAHSLAKSPAIVVGHLSTPGSVIRLHIYISSWHRYQLAGHPALCSVKEGALSANRMLLKFRLIESGHPLFLHTPRSGTN